MCVAIHGSEFSDICSLNIMSYKVINGYYNENLTSNGIKITHT